MINAIFLLVTVFCVSIQSVLKKEYNKRLSVGAYTFSAASTLFALLFFILTDTGGFAYASGVLTYSFGFALAYSVSVVTSFLALCNGPILLTSLIASYSLVIPTLYGIFALGEPVDFLFFIGVGALMISLVLVNMWGKQEEGKANLKWVIYVLLAFFSNGMCSVVQKIQQIRFDGEYKNEFMIVALAFVVVAVSIIALISERRYVGVVLKKGFVWYSSCGVANGVTNLLVIVLCLRMPASIVYPVITAGGVVVMALFSIFMYKEKLSLPQTIGAILGLVSVVMLAI